MAANATTPANAGLVIDQQYVIAITGFTYIRDYALIRGKESSSGEAVSVIIGDKQNFSMSDMFQLKQSNGIRATYKRDKVANGVTYKQFQLDEILF